MYGAIQPAIRASTPRRPLRFVHARRYPSAPRARLFHSTRCLAHDPTPPIGPDSRPANGDGQDKKTRERAPAIEQADPGIASEDPEVLAQKLQRSKEMTRRYSSALRRSQRRARGRDLPPVIVPDWFLKRRIFLREETRRQPHDSGEGTVVLSLQRRGSDEASVISVPLGNSWNAVTLLARLLLNAWDGALSAGQRRQFAKKLAAYIGAGDHENVLNALQRGVNPNATTEKLRAEIQAFLKPLKRELAEATTLIQGSSNEHLQEIITKLQSQEKELARLDTGYNVLSRDMMRRKSRLPPFVVAEIRATIAACLSVVPPAPKDAFPSARTNLVLHSPSSELEEPLFRMVLSIASELQSDLIVLEAQDLAEIAGDYLGEGPEPSSKSIRSLGYETYRLSSDLAADAEEFRNETVVDDQEDGTISSSPASAGRQPLPMTVIAVAPALKALAQGIKNLQVPVAEEIAPSNEPQGRTQTQSEAQLEDLKLAHLLETLIDAADLKRSRSLVDTAYLDEAPIPSSTASPTSPSPEFFDFSISPSSDKIDLSTALPHRAAAKFSLNVNIGTFTKLSTPSPRPKIIYVKDIKELNATHYGGRIIQKLEDIVRRQRNVGERIMILGTTCSQDLTPELTASGVQGLQSEGEAGFFRTIVVPADMSENTWDQGLAHSSDASKYYLALERMSSAAEKKKFRSVNIRHIQDMLRCLDPVATEHLTREPFQDDLGASTSLFPHYYSWKVLTHDEIHRIALVALGLHRLDPVCEQLNWGHVALAMGLLKASDNVKFDYVKVVAQGLKPYRNSEQERKDSTEGTEKETTGTSLGSRSPSSRDRERQLQAISGNATKYEKRLIPGIADPHQIKTTFEQVHVSIETKESIRTLTSLSLLRPDAFDYGVLAAEKISGALLYGPPGTGKTLLAKAVAKESGCTVLEVSGSQIMDKYVGEGEKNVTAIFSLARKLSPCIVFLDEADALFASRDAGRERSSHRDILNQFLKEWDGLNDLSVFVMVATNRPFDLDDAVIRRLPRRLLVDLPTEADRLEILKIHLRGEQLDDSVSLEDLAKRTPFYSGSDLKNLAVYAALACVKEENERAIVEAAKAEGSETSPSSLKHPQQLVRNKRYTFPEKRILSSRHFDMALQEISASISEDMSSLNAIKKFDEKYGDKKGRRKKRVFGIGINTETNENVVRVRT